MISLGIQGPSSLPRESLATGLSSDATRSNHWQSPLSATCEYVTETMHAPEITDGDPLMRVDSAASLSINGSRGSLQESNDPSCQGPTPARPPRSLRCHSPHPLTASETTGQERNEEIADTQQSMSHLGRTTQCPLRHLLPRHLNTKQTRVPIQERSGLL